MLKQILTKIESTSFLSAPYKILVIDDFIPEPIYTALESHFPENPSYISAIDLFESSNELWKSYLKSVNSVDFYNCLLKKFQVDIKLTEENLGLRKKDLHKHYVTESYTMTRKGSNIDPLMNDLSKMDSLWMLPPHNDSQYTLLSLVHYIPQPSFNNFTPSSISKERGSFFVVKPRKTIRYFNTNSIITYAYPEDFDVIQEIPYQKNRAVVVLRDVSSWHGIGPCDFIRRSVNMSLELQNNGKRNLC